ncbi:MAG: hypothetical protein NTX24_01780 [Candidatus Pacearchaeota archaeon]|nr:hypothetical protein [Candidatus Pacearchaeota archaeon]
MTEEITTSLQEDTGKATVYAIASQTLEELRLNLKTNKLESVLTGFILLEGATLVPLCVSASRHNNSLILAGFAAFYSVFGLGYVCAKVYDNRQKERERIEGTNGNV